MHDHTDLARAYTHALAGSGCHVVPVQGADARASRLRPRARSAPLSCPRTMPAAPCCAAAHPYGASQVWVTLTMQVLCRSAAMPSHYATRHPACPLCKQNGQSQLLYVRECVLDLPQKSYRHQTHSQGGHSRWFPRSVQRVPHQAGHTRVTLLGAHQLRADGLAGQLPRERGVELRQAAQLGRGAAQRCLAGRQAGDQLPRAVHQRRQARQQCSLAAVQQAVPRVLQQDAGSRSQAEEAQRQEALGASFTHNIIHRKPALHDK